MRDNTDENGCLISIIGLALIIGSGMLAWEWFNPQSFFGYIGFLITWGIFGKVGLLIIGFITMILNERN